MKENDFKKITDNIKKEIEKEIKEMSEMTKEDIVENRYQKFRNISSFNV